MNVILVYTHLLSFWGVIIVLFRNFGIKKIFDLLIRLLAYLLISLLNVTIYHYFMAF